MNWPRRLMLRVVFGVRIRNRKGRIDVLLPAKRANWIEKTEAQIEAGTFLGGRKVIAARTPRGLVIHTQAKGEAMRIEFRVASS